MSKLKISLILMILGVMVFSCKKDENLLPLPIAPAIKILEISNDTIVEFKEQLKLKLEYEDGDGDLGNKDTDINSLFIKDVIILSSSSFSIFPCAKFILASGTNS